MKIKASMPAQEDHARFNTTLKVFLLFYLNSHQIGVNFISCGVIICFTNLLNRTIFLKLKDIKTTKNKPIWEDK